MPEITVKLGDKTLQTCKFDGELLRIGRSRENDVVLENLSVSRHHAQIRFHGGQYIITDMSSANGTLVNGVKITKTEVVDEDVITIGKHKLLFCNQPVEQAEDLSMEQRTMMVEPKAEAWLVVEEGRLKGREFKIVRFETTLGKAPTNDVVLTEDWLLAKKQAIILRKGNHSFEIQDLGGLRKIKVNGSNVSDRVDLKDGDRIEMGGTALIFRATAGAPRPTGRMPKELKSDASEPKMVQAAFARAAAAEDNFGSIENESLDLEDSYRNVKVTLKDVQRAPAPVDNQVPDESLPVTDPGDDAGADTDMAIEVPVEEARNENKPDPAAEAVPDKTAPADPEVEVETAATPSQPGAELENGAAAYNNSAGYNNGNGQSQNGHSRDSQRNVFEDTRSGTRRKRKHQQRAAQKQEVSDSGISPGREEPAQNSVALANESREAKSVMADDKEIQMWETALNNASPAIRRQAARTLKKLTGRDYDV